MADEKELEIEEKGGKKKLIIIIGAVVLLIAIGVGAFLFMGSSDEPADFDEAIDDSEVAAASAENESKEVGSALYVPMPRPFVFTVPGASRDRTVQIRAQLLVRGASNEETVKKNIPLIESVLLDVFQQANADDLATHAGKKALRQKTLVEVQKTLKDLLGDTLVEQVLFTGFVMQ